MSHEPVNERVFSTPPSLEEIESALAAEEGLDARRGGHSAALIQDDGDATFIRRATLALAQTGQCEIVMLLAGETPVAAAIVLRHRDRAFYFKLGVDERFAKFSPGVQLTLDLTRHLCADPAVRTVDSTANADHPMINPIWRGRLAIGETVPECLNADLKLETAARTALVSAVAVCETANDYVSREMVVAILEDAEEHIDFLETELGLLEKVGEQNYLQSQMGEGKDES